MNSFKKITSTLFAILLLSYFTNTGLLVRKQISVVYHPLNVITLLTFK